ncbi:unnamed protein product, partial [Didymodactylos carnosus]
ADAHALKLLKMETEYDENRMKVDSLETKLNETERRYISKRLTYEEQVMASLLKWRRHHIRAKIDDILSTLKQIHRFDLVSLVENRVVLPSRSARFDGRDDREEQDPRQREINELNRKLNRLFEKINSGAIRTRDTYVYTSLGMFDKYRPQSKGPSSPLDHMRSRKSIAVAKALLERRKTIVH